MSLLALQFGCQPALTRKYTPATTCRSAVIMMQECVKFAVAIFMLSSSGQLKPSLEGWTVSSWLTIAFLPAALYVVQNLSALMAYQNLHPVTFNVLNQTKTVRNPAPFMPWVYWLVGQSSERHIISQFSHLSIYYFSYDRTNSSVVGGTLLLADHWTEAKQSADICTVSAPAFGAGHRKDCNAG